MTEADRQLAYIAAEMQKDRDPLDLALLARRQNDILRRRGRDEKKMMF